MHAFSRPLCAAAVKLKHAKERYARLMQLVDELQLGSGVLDTLIDQLGKFLCFTYAFTQR